MTATHLVLFRDIPPAYWLVAFVLYLSTFAALGPLVRTHYPHRAFGAANVVTLFRGALTLSLVTPLVSGASPGWPVFAVALLAAALDGVDGWLARRTGLASDFGARFDMETDSLLALILALHALADGLAWPVAVILGGSRYLFLGAAAVAPWLSAPLPQRFSRKAVCAIQLSVLVALQAPPLAGGQVVPVAGLAALAVLLSFSRDILWLWERRAPTAPPRRRWLSAALGALLLQLLLAQPSHPARLDPALLLQPSLELAVILPALIALGNSAVGRAFRACLTCLMTAMVVLKSADLASHMILGRSFDPVADMPQVDALFRMIDGAFGGLAASGAAVGAVLLIGSVAAAIWWATGVWARLGPLATGRRLAGLGCGLAAVVVAAEARLLPDSWLTTEIPGKASATQYAVHTVGQARATLAGLREFTAAARRDEFAGATGLLDAIDRDVLVIFIESYGRASLDTPFYAERHRATLATASARLSDLGLASRSSYLAAPTRGGMSWLSHASFSNGLWVDNQSRYRALLASHRESLLHIAGRSGFRTAAVMPAITMPWPEADGMGFGTVLVAKDLGYRGLPFNWVTMPDQFTLAALDRLLRQGPENRRLFAQVALVSSHAPWVPVPQLLDWETLGDGSVFDEMATSGDPPKVVWRDPERVRTQYREAVDYALSTVFDYAARHAQDPPFMIVLGDHQTAASIALDERPDVPIHLIGPPELLARIDAWGWREGLVPAPAQVTPMDRMRDMILRAFTTASTAGDAG